MSASTKFLLDCNLCSLFDKNLLTFFQILTDEKLHVIGDPTNNVYALGDCADIKDNSLPCIAQVTAVLCE